MNRSLDWYRGKARSSASEKPELRHICEPRSTQYSHPIICAPLSSTRFLIRSSTVLPLRTAWLNRPMPIIILGWYAQISIGSIPLPVCGSRPVIFFIIRGPNL